MNRTAAAVVDLSLSGDDVDFVYFYVDTMERSSSMTTSETMITLTLTTMVRCLDGHKKKKKKYDHDCDHARRRKEKLSQLLLLYCW